MLKYLYHHRVVFDDELKVGEKKCILILVKGRIKL